MTSPVAGFVRLDVGTVTLTVVRNEVEAEVVCGLLRSNGIGCSYRKTDIAVGAWDATGMAGPSAILASETDLGTEPAAAGLTPLRFSNGGVSACVGAVHRLEPRGGRPCDDPADWRWSSYAAIARDDATFPFPVGERVLEVFDADRPEAIRRLRAFVDEGLLDATRQVGNGSDPVTRV